MLSICVSYTIYGKHVYACAEALEVPEIPYFFDQTPRLLLFSLIIFVQLLFEGGVYSKTSNNGPSEKRTTSVQRTAHLPPIDFTIELIHVEPPRSGHLSTPNNGH